MCILRAKLPGLQTRPISSAIFREDGGNMDHLSLYEETRIENVEIALTKNENGTLDSRLSFFTGF